MNRDMELAHLAIAQKAVTLGERHVLQQERRIAELDRDGHDTQRALATLATFRKMQAEHVAHRDLLLKILQQDMTRPQPPKGSVCQADHREDNPQLEAQIDPSRSSDS